MMKSITLVPWSGFLLLYLVVLHSIDIDFSMGSIASMLAIVFSVIVLIIEFYKSGDISFNKFILNITFSLMALVIATWLFSYLVHKEMKIYFVDYMVYGIIIVDSWISPVNAFRTALRNLQIGNSDNAASM